MIASQESADEAMMRALVLEELGGPLHLRALPVPQPGPGEVLLRVRACAVDHLDVALRAGGRRTPPLPLILGHEIAGEVAALGSEVDDWDIGDRVASTLYLTCGRCRQCLRGRETICERFRGYIGGETPGGYAEYTLVPGENLVALPESISFPQGSILANAVGTPYHALVKRMRLQPGERIVITGAGGGVGVHAVQIARMVGARVMAVDVSPAKLAAAEDNGAELTVDPSTVSLRDAILEWTEGLGAEGVLELVGPATMTDTLAALGRGGRMVVVGSQTGREVTIDPMELFRHEWELLGSRNCTKLELREVTDLVAAGRLHPVVSEVHPLDEAEHLHERQRAHDIVGRAVLEP